MKHYSGKFVLRVPAELHQALVYRSHHGQQSLNQLCADLLSQGLQGAAATHTRHPLLDKVQADVVPKLKKAFKQDLLAVLCFGSYVKGEASEASDLDVLIVLSNRVPITRKLYRQWDQVITWSAPPELSPHFVHTPARPTQASSLWLEVAENFEVLFQKSNTATRVVKSLLLLIQQGTVRKYWSNGHPYWVWSKDEK